MPREPRRGRRAGARAYLSTLLSMTTARVTVTLPQELRDSAQRAADDEGVPFSAVVTEALTSWTRARLVDRWLAEHQAEFGAFDEEELRAVALEAGVPYVAPNQGRTKV